MTVEAVNLLDNPDIATGRQDGASARLAALVMLGTAGVTTFLAMPVIAAALANRLGMDDHQIGLFSTIQLITLSVGCLISVVLPRGHVRRHGRLALIVMIACDAASITSPHWQIFLVLRGLSGCAGGIAVSQATAALAATRNAERSFGLFTALQTLVAVLCVYVMPPLVEQFGFGAAYALLLLFNLLALALVSAALRPATAETALATAGHNDARAWAFSAGLLISILCFFVGIGAVWTFLALLAQRVGLGGAEVAAIITFSKLVAFVASFVPGLVASRIGRITPIVAAVGVLILAVQLMAHSTSFIAFAAATACFSFGWYSLYPFQLAALADVDRDGRPMLASAALTGIGLGIGPTLATFGSLGIYNTASFAFAAAALTAVAAIVGQKASRA